MFLALAAAVIFPGPIKEVRSPTSKARIFYREHLNGDGGQAHPVFLDHGHGHVTRLATVTRNMSVSWSPDGRFVFLQDNYGSNVADCYVVTATRSTARGSSLFKAVEHSPGHPRGAESPSASHYYVTCERWRSAHQLLGSVQGHTDSNPSHGFDHQFSYDPAYQVLRWRRWRKTAEGR